MPKRKKKILTLDDLVAFCETGKITRFSSKESGYQLCVHTPSVIKYSDSVEETDSTLYAYVKLFHTGKNRNHSNVTEDAAKNSLDGIKYKPILANFTDQTEDGEWDFTSHDIEINDDGTYEYIEKQVGCFTADEAILKYDEEEKKNFVFAKMAIPKDYTMTADILKRKNGSKVSVELTVNEMSYNVKTKTLDLTDIEVKGCTLLGTDPYTQKPVEEGMKGAKASLTDFSVDNNSVFNEKTDEELIKMLGNLNDTLSGYFNSQMQKGGKSKMGKFEELLKKYNVTEEDIKFDYTTMSDEELESAFKTAFDEEADDGTEDGTDESSGLGEDGSGTEVTDPDGSEESEPVEPELDTDDLSEAIDSVDDLNEDDYTEESWEALQEALEAAQTALSSATEQDDINEAKDNLNSAISNLVRIVKSDDDEDEEKRKKNQVTASINDNVLEVKFELSHEDIRSALYNLLSTVERDDNDWYYICNTYDDYFVFQSWIDGSYYGMKYTRDGDNLSLDGEKYNVYLEFLTEEEKSSLDDLRSENTTLKNQLKEFKAEADEKAKEEIINDISYQKYLNEPEFRELIENKDKYSVEEFNTLADVAFAKCVKRFSFAQDKPSKKKSLFSAKEKKSKNPYGNIFKN